MPLINRVTGGLQTFKRTHLSWFVLLISRLEGGVSNLRGLIFFPAADFCMVLCRTCPGGSFFFPFRVFPLVCGAQISQAFLPCARATRERHRFLAPFFSVPGAADSHAQAVGYKYNKAPASLGYHSHLATKKMAETGIDLNVAPPLDENHGK
jgi:hypothetical protein